MDVKFQFGSDKTTFLVRDNALNIHLKSVLLGKRKEWNVISGVSIQHQTGNKVFFANREVSGGIFVETLDTKLPGKAYHMYNEILQRTKDMQLCRAWNFIPCINQHIHGHEVYEMYNKGRSEAFSHGLKNPQIQMPAATGIDILGDRLVVAFLATIHPVQHLHNPLQVDSYHYPEQFEKYPPSFSRATKTILNGKKVVFVSGTASIRGSESVHTDDLYKQTDTTIENIELMLQQAGITEDVKRGRYSTEKIIYLKKKEHIQPLRDYIAQHHPQYHNGIYLQAHVCRKELDVEISFTAVEK